MTGGAGDLICLGALVGRAEGGRASVFTESVEPFSTLIPFIGTGDAAEVL